MKPLPHGTPACTSVTPFGGNPFTTGVINLHGCTSIIILTDKGIYNSHFWDSSSFSQSIIPIHGPAIFENDVLRPIKPGLRFLTSNDTLLEGHPACNQCIRDEDEPQDFIFSPKKRNTNFMQYPAQIEKTVQALWDVLPSAYVRVVGHVNVGRANSVLMDADFIDPGFGDMGQLEGKVVVDYQPRSRLQDGRVGFGGGCLDWGSGGEGFEEGVGMWGVSVFSSGV
ncbi:hypothetical protein RU639_010624 [Aspergillus parasiticus]